MLTRAIGNAQGGKPGKMAPLPKIRRDPQGHPNATFHTKKFLESEDLIDLDFDQERNVDSKESKADGKKPTEEKEEFVEVDLDEDYVQVDADDAEWEKV